MKSLSVSKAWILCACLLGGTLAFLIPSSAAAADSGVPSDNPAKISIHRVLPDDKTFNEVMAMLEKAKTNPPESITKEYGAILQNSENPILRGVYNTYYKNAVDLPLTSFVLGYAEIDAGRLFVMFKALQEAQDPSGGSGDEPGVGGVLGSSGSSFMGDIKKLRDDFESSMGPQITVFLKETQSAFKILMNVIPLFILGISISALMLNIAYQHLVNPVTAARIQILPVTILRFCVFFIAIVTFRFWIVMIIEFSNYVSLAIVPVETQEKIMEFIVQRSVTSFNEGDTFSNMFANFFRSLTYLALKILFIARDMLLTLTVLWGGTCIALGAYSNFSHNSDPVHAFLTGWVEGLVKLLFWGPFGAIMIVGMGIVSLMSSVDAIGTLAVVTSSLAFLFAAGNVPKLSEKLSGLVLMSLMTHYGGPIIQKSLSILGSNAGAAAGGGLSRAVAALVSKFRKGALVGGAMGSVVGGASPSLFGNPGGGGNGSPAGIPPTPFPESTAAASGAPLPVQASVVGDGHPDPEEEAPPTLPSSVSPSSETKGQPNVVLTPVADATACTNDTPVTNPPTLSTVSVSGCLGEHEAMFQFLRKNIQQGASSNVHEMLRQMQAKFTRSSPLENAAAIAAIQTCEAKDVPERAFDAIAQAVSEHEDWQNMSAEDFMNSVIEKIPHEHRSNTAPAAAAAAGILRIPRLCPDGGGMTQVASGLTGAIKRSLVNFGIMDDTSPSNMACEAAESVLPALRPDNLSCETTQAPATYRPGRPVQTVSREMAGYFSKEIMNSFESSVLQYVDTPREPDMGNSTNPNRVV